MKKVLSMAMILAMTLSSASPVFAEEFIPPQADGKGVVGGRADQAWRKNITEGVEFSEVTSMDTPPTNHWALYTTSSGLFIEDDAGSATQLTAGSGDNTLDNAYDQGGAGLGRTITADTGAVALTNTDADTAFLFTINAAPSSSAALGGAQITTGANSTQDALEFVNGGTGYDIYGTSGTWTASKAGAITGASVDLSGALAADGLVALGNGTTTVAVNSSAWNITTAGAASGFSTMALSGDITLANGQAVQSSTTTAETMALQGYDVDNTTYRDTVSLTNGNTIAAAIGTGLETVAIDSTTWDVATTGAFTGVADITGTAGAAMTVTIASDGAADDLTLSVTGATDSSVHVASSGTGEDAISLQASAGGIDIDGLAAKNIDIAGGQVLISSKDDAGSAIALTTNVGTSETIVVTNTQGTGDAALNIDATAGGIDVDAAKSIAIASSEAQADAVTLAASAGGIDITSAATFDIDVTATGGTVQVVASEAAANQFKVDAQGTIAGNAIVLETTDGGIQLNADNASNGDIAIDAADDMTLTAGGDLTLAVTGTVSAGTSAITDVLSDSEVVAAANTIAATECGKIFYLSDATEFQSILPTASGLAGCNMRFVVGAAPSGASYTVVTGNSLENLIYGLAVVNGASVAAAAEDTITFADGAAVKGDWVSLGNDGTSWYVSGQGTAAGGITLTQAD